MTVTTFRKWQKTAGILWILLVIFPVVLPVLPEQMKIATISGFFAVYLCAILTASKIGFDKRRVWIGFTIISPHITLLVMLFRDYKTVRQNKAAIMMEEKEKEKEKELQKSFHEFEILKCPPGECVAQHCPNCGQDHCHCMPCETVSLFDHQSYYSRKRVSRNHRNQEAKIKEKEIFDQKFEDFDENDHKEKFIEALKGLDDLKPISQVQFDELASNYNGIRKYPSASMVLNKGVVSFDNKITGVSINSYTVWISSECKTSESEHLIARDKNQFYIFGNSRYI